MNVTIDQAVATLRAGGVVGMPTETVYGLAADARDAAAVRRIFDLKGRPSTNPLIVHVASVAIADRYAAVSDVAYELFARFSPGPLTIVLPCEQSRVDELRRSVCSAVTAGLHTVGIRIPDHPVALELLRAFDGPVAAPSANLSNHVSPTLADHVRTEFGDAVPVLDGGPCRVGIESTVLSLAGERPQLLRPGSISREAIEAIIGPIEVFQGHRSRDVAAPSPGQGVVHYAPRTAAFRFEAGDVGSLAAGAGDLRRGLIATQQTLDRIGSGFAQARLLGGDPATAAHGLYAILRELDGRSLSAIYIEMPPDAPHWAALRDRLTRATRPLGSTPADA